MLIASWKSIKPEENRYRHYSLRLEKDLWGDEVLIKRWGRLNERKRENYFWVKDQGDLLRKIEEVADIREMHGYRLKKNLFN